MSIHQKEKGLKLKVIAPFIKNVETFKSLFDSLLPVKLAIGNS